MAIITPEGASHWYFPDGKPCHRQPYKDKKRAAAGETRATHVGDARKLGLLPSVTNVLGMMAKPMLTAWGREQVLLLASKNPRFQVETDEDYVLRIEEMHQEWIERLRGIGHKTHSAMEDHAQGRLWDPADYMGASFPIDRARDWFDLRVRSIQHTEKTVVSGKYAGTLDLICELRSPGLARPGTQITIVDYKTRRSGWGRGSDGSWKCATYREDVIQLAAYRAALCEQVGFPFDTPLMSCCSVIIPSEDIKEIGAPRMQAFEKKWTMEELARGKKTFDYLLDAWQSEKNYTI